MNRLLVLLSLLLFATPTSARRWYVPGDFYDVQSAIDGAQPGDTIVIQGGTWGPLVVDKPLHLMGDPTTTIYGGGTPPLFESPITLAGPGFGTVVLSRIEVGGWILAHQYQNSAAGVSGTGFSELLVYDSTIHGPYWGSWGSLSLGASGIDVTCPFVLVERCDVRASASKSNAVKSSTAPDGAPGINVNGTVALFDSLVWGGDSGPYCYGGFSCPSPCPGSLGGRGGNGVVCSELFHSNNAIQGGTGALWACWSSPFVCDIGCCSAAGGIPVVTTHKVVLGNDLRGSGPMILGDPYTLTWTTPGPVAVLYMSLGINTPWPYSGAGYVFIDQGTLLSWGVMPSPGSLTATIPANLAFVGYSVAFQLLDATGQVSRPVSGYWMR